MGEMAKDGKVLLANGAWARYDRVDPPYGGFLFFDAKRPEGFVLRVVFRSQVDAFEVAAGGATADGGKQGEQQRPCRQDKKLHPVAAGL